MSDWDWRSLLVLLLQLLCSHLVPFRWPRVTALMHDTYETRPKCLLRSDDGPRNRVSGKKCPDGASRKLDAYLFFFHRDAVGWPIGARGFETKRHLQSRSQNRVAFLSMPSAFLIAYEIRTMLHSKATMR